VSLCSFVIRDYGVEALLSEMCFVTENATSAAAQQSFETLSFCVNVAERVCSCLIV
jgi:hypothetical protein